MGVYLPFRGLGMLADRPSLLQLSFNFSQKEKKNNKNATLAEIVVTGRV